MIKNCQKILFEKKLSDFFVMPVYLSDFPPSLSKSLQLVHSKITLLMWLFKYCIPVFFAVGPLSAKIIWPRNPQIQ